MPEMGQERDVIVDVCSFSVDFHEFSWFVADTFFLCQKPGEAKKAAEDQAYRQEI